VKEKSDETTPVFEKDMRSELRALCASSQHVGENRTLKLWQMSTTEKSPCVK